MYARITRFRVKPERMSEGLRKFEDMRSRLLDIPGLRQFKVILYEDGGAIGVSVVDHTAMTERAQSQMRAIWLEFAPYLETPPEEPTIGEIAIDWER